MANGRGQATDTHTRDPKAAFVRAVLRQMAESQWYTEQRLATMQRERLRALLHHAAETVPYYRRRLHGVDLNSTVNSPDDWRRLPVLTRRDVQLAGPDLASTSPKYSSSKCRPIVTSGSTGEPVMVLQPPRVRLIWGAITLREHLWHGRDLSGTLAVIRHVGRDRALAPNGQVEPNWGEATRWIKTGPAALLNIDCTVKEQATWLAAQNPTYLLTYPSNLHSLARHFEVANLQLTQLKGIRSLGEVLRDDTRELCERVFRAPVVDTYTSQEVGYIALQCPKTSNYHVQSENVLLEVLDEQGQPCRPGEAGRLLVTALHNFATPLIRYAIGDYAIPGERCACGRGLPVLTRIMGRERNMLVLPTGERRWPALGHGEDLAGLPSFHQVQIVQRTLQDVQVRAVVPEALTPSQEDDVRDYVRRMLGHPFEITFEYVQEIPRTAGAKFEDFRCEVEE